MKTFLEIKGKRYRVRKDKIQGGLCSENGCALIDVCSPSNILCEEFTGMYFVHFELDDGET